MCSTSVGGIIGYAEHYAFGVSGNSDETLHSKFGYGERGWLRTSYGCVVSLRRWLLVRRNLFLQSQGSQRVVQTESLSDGGHQNARLGARSGSGV